MDPKEANVLIIHSLEIGLARLRGERVAIREMSREQHAESSSFTTELIHILLNNGEQFDVFFKDLNPANQLDAAQKLRERSLERSRRELIVYQEMLTQTHLGTPELYGYRWEPERSIYWIFLEHTGSHRLCWTGEFRLWLDATRWLARLHTIAPKRFTEAVNHPPEYDERHFLSCAERIEKNLPELESSQQQVIDAALHHYYGLLGYLTGLPHCFIHGEYFCENILIRREIADNAFAVVDWETAALGPRGVDIVSITAGKWSIEQRHAMWNAYAERYEQQSGQAIDRVEFHRELECVALYRALWWLGHWAQGDDAKVMRWIRELEAIMSDDFPAPTQTNG